MDTESILDILGKWPNTLSQLIKPKTQKNYPSLIEMKSEKKDFYYFYEISGNFYLALKAIKSHSVTDYKFISEIEAALKSQHEVALKLATQAQKDAFINEYFSLLKSLIFSLNPIFFSKEYYTACAELYIKLQSTKTMRYMENKNWSQDFLKDMKARVPEQIFTEILEIFEIPLNYEELDFFSSPPKSLTPYPLEYVSESTEDEEDISDTCLFNPNDQSKKYDCRYFTASDSASFENPSKKRKVEETDFPEDEKSDSKDLRY